MIGLVGCAAQKLDQPAPARELYTSRLFRAALAYAEARCARTYVLSALHGIVELDQVVEPYDQRLGSVHERSAWASRIVNCLIDRHGDRVNFLLLAGLDYAAPIDAELEPPDGCRCDHTWLGVRVPRGRVLQPLVGMTIGQRLRFLSDDARGEA